MDVPAVGLVDTTLGFQGTREDTIALWKAAARRWRDVARRPTAGDIAVYRRLAGPKLSGRVLLLGTTPELRDLIASTGGRPVVVDISAAMHEATSAMLSCADPAGETWIEADWCEADLPAGGFDLVLGDQVWWALSVAKQHDLRDAIHAALDGDGLFVGRVRFSDPARATQSAFEAVSARLQRLDRPGADRRAIETELLYWLYDHTADHEGMRLNIAGTKRLLHDLAQTRELRRYASCLRRVSTHLVGADWTSQTREQLIGLLSASFDVVAEERASDYDSSLHPVLAMRPR